MTELFTVIRMVMVTVWLGLIVPMLTFTVLAAALVVTVPCVVAAPEMSRNEEKVSVTRTFVTGAVPVLVMMIRKVKRSPLRASPGVTDNVILILGVRVPVGVGVGGVPVTVGVKVGVLVKVGVRVGGVPVTVGVCVSVAVEEAVGVRVSVAVAVLVDVGVGVTVSVGVAVSVAVEVGVSVAGS